MEDRFGGVVKCDRHLLLVPDVSKRQHRLSHLIQRRSRSKTSKNMTTLLYIYSMALMEKFVHDHTSFYLRPAAAADGINQSRRAKPYETVNVCGRLGRGYEHKN